MNLSRRKVSSKIIAVDFDGTIVEENYPEIGNEIPGALDTIRALQKNGHKVFLWTMRCKGRLQEAVDWIESKGIYLDGINRSPAQFSDSPKQFANVYIDDRNFETTLRKTESGKLVLDWSGIAETFKVAGLIEDADLKEILKNFEEDK